MSRDNNANHDKPVFRGYVINEKGEEVPITDDMVAKSMAEAKLKSIGAHTGYTKAVTDEMLQEHDSKKQ
ncbi:MAG: PA1571 family protein [Cellvibrionaceae bacterium]